MTLLIVPLLTAGIAIGNFQAVDAGGLGDVDCNVDKEEISLDLFQGEKFEGDKTIQCAGPSTDITSIAIVVCDEGIDVDIQSAGGTSSQEFFDEVVEVEVDTLPGNYHCVVTFNLVIDVTFVFSQVCGLPDGTAVDIDTTFTEQDCFNAGGVLTTSSIDEQRFDTLTQDIWVLVLFNNPPEITAPPNVTVECNEFGGATGVDLGEPTVTDPDGNDLPPTNDAAEPFSLGPTTVNWQVTDTGGLTDSDTQTVTVEDTIDPNIVAPAGFMAIANTNGGWSGVIGQATATDVCDSNVDITNDAPAVFPLGDTIVEWCATDDLGNASCDTQIINVKPLPVDIDIKPGSDPNSINLKGNGIIPVAILGTTNSGFNVLDVDVTTLAFGPNGAPPIHLVGAHFEDVDDDGYLDLVSHFRTQQTGIVIGTLEACITGLNNGIQFRGCDDIRTIPEPEPTPEP